MAFLIGSSTKLQANFVDEFGAPTNPTTVTLTIRDPTGVQTTPSPTNDQPGSYYYILSLTLAGEYLYRFAGTGAVIAAVEGVVIVTPSIFTTGQAVSAWTYSGDPYLSPKDEVRFLIADTDQSKSWTLMDAEINYAIRLHSGSPPQIGHNFLAAAVCAETILGKFKAIAQSKTVGDLSIEFGQQFQFYAALAKTLRNRAALDMVKPYVGGTSVGEKFGVNSDPDRVQPAFKIDGMDMASPINNANNPTGGDNGP